MKRFAAVDEKEGVVWGVGITSDAARDDAVRWLNEIGSHREVPTMKDISVHEITKVQEATIYRGDVRWPVRSRE